MALLALSLLAAQRGTLLETLTWPEAEKVLRPETVVVIPLGAAAKEHGAHMRLDADFVMAEYFKKELIERTEVVVAPTVSYGFNPPFIEYPGSTTLELETSRDTIVDICRSLSRFGPKRFYVLNIGVTTVRALQPAAATLAGEGMAMKYTDVILATQPLERRIGQQEGGTHADEVETSIMLYIAPRQVNMTLAKKDFEPRQGTRLTRELNNGHTFSPTGVWGDPTFATRAKGANFTRALLESMLADIEALRAMSP